MTNEIPAHIETPEVPEDFGPGREFAQKLLELIRQINIIYNPVTNPDTFDAAKLTQQVADLNARVDKGYKKTRKIIVNCITDSEVPVVFEDIGTTLYSVLPILIVPTGTPTPSPASIALVADKKTTSSCVLYCKGALSPFQMEVTILEIRPDA
jgi:hypothetical protein